jgi:hypothetical protein
MIADLIYLDISCVLLDKFTQAGGDNVRKDHAY